MNFAPKTLAGLTPSAFVDTVRFSTTEGTVLFRTPGSTITVARVPWSGLTASAYIRSMDQPGCYAIVSQSGDVDIDSSVYVGSSGQIKRRLHEHKRDKRHKNALWIYVISASSLDVTSSHMRQLEGILRRTTAVQPRVDVTSGRRAPLSHVAA